MADAQVVEPTVATPSGVEANASVAPTGGPSLADWQALVEENKRIGTEKENYRKGMLLAKGKLKAGKNFSDDEETDDLESLIDKKVEERLLSAQASLVEKKQSEYVQKLIDNNKEMALALQNKNQLPNASSGSAQSKGSEVTNSPWSKEQLAEFAKKGIDPKKVWDNLNK